MNEDTAHELDDSIFLLKTFFFFYSIPQNYLVLGRTEDLPWTGKILSPFFRRVVTLELFTFPLPSLRQKEEVQDLDGFLLPSPHPDPSLFSGFFLRQSWDRCHGFGDDLETSPETPSTGMCEISCAIKGCPLAVHAICLPTQTYHLFCPVQ